MTHFQCPECDKEGKTESELRKNGCKCKIESLQMLDFEDHIETRNSKDERKDNKKLFDHILNKIHALVISENNTDEIFALVKREKNTDVLKVTSRRFRDWLCNEFMLFINSDEIKSDEFFKSIANSIYSYARMNNSKTAIIYNRIAQLDDQICYFLSRDDGKIIQITAKGVQTSNLSLKSPIFRRVQSLQEQVMPKRDDENALEKLLDLLKISLKDRLVFKIHLVTLFLEAINVPMMVIGGTAGSFKTTTNAMIKRIVDPSGNEKEDNVSTIPTNTDDLILHLNNRYLASFDNVSYISKEQSDIFCRAITGNSNSKRKLYTDDEESIFSFKRKIILNGIVPNLDYPDLQSRLLFYERDSVDNNSRLTEQDLEEKFAILLPNVLGQIFLILYQALSLHKRIKFEIKPKTRMSDFEVYGEVISRIIGNEKNQFLVSYHKKLEDASVASQESFPLITVVEHLMKEQNEYEGTAKDLHASLVSFTRILDIDISSKYVIFPKAPNKLWKSFQEIDDMLKRNGFQVRKFSWTSNDSKYVKHSTIFKITKTVIQSTLDKVSSPSSLSSPPAQKLGEDSEHSEDSEDKLYD